MEIIRGKIAKAQKICVYGPEGIGKSTFASQFPDPVFIDTEGSTANMDVARTKKPSSWVMLLDQVKYFRDHPAECRTLVIDTADWAERICTEHVCAKAGKDGVEDFGYGKGYTYVKEEFGKLLNLLEEVKEAGIHVVLTAHAALRKIEQPEETGAYDHWELKLSKQVAPIVKEWTDALFFANYKIHVIKQENGTKKANGGKRVMYTTHTPTWDAKNRYGLPDELPFEFEQISHIIRTSPMQETATNPPAPAVAEKSSESPKEDFIHQMEMDFNNPQPVKKAEKAPEAPVPNVSVARKKLNDLMAENLVNEEEVRWVVAKRGFFPMSTPMENYPDDFIEGWIIANWDKVYGMIRSDLDKSEDNPFIK